MEPLCPNNTLAPKPWAKEAKALAQGRWASFYTPRDGWATLGTTPIVPQRLGSFVKGFTHMTIIQAYKGHGPKPN